jgi:hypothetical protein
VVELLRQAVPVSALVVAVDTGEVSNQVWLTSGERGLSGNRCRCRCYARAWRPPAACTRPGCRAGTTLAGVGAAVCAIRDPGGQKPARRAAVQHRRPRLCGAGVAGPPGRRAASRHRHGGYPVGAVRHRRGLVRDRRVLQQRLHDQLQALCPGLSARPAVAVGWPWAI